MRRLTVGLGARSYDIVIAGGAIGDADTHLAPFCRKQRAVIVTDTHVAKAWLTPLSEALARVGIAADPIVLPAGEATKSWGQLESLVEALLARSLDRDEYLFALGGGVIGDLAGFAAALVKRGCGFVQIPTSLLAQVDSSVGGKTAINSRAGKNLVGAFHQPTFVLIDPEVLKTLPDREMRAGYAEVIKYGLIDDPEFFAWCEANGGRVLARDAEALGHAIETSVTAKARVVAADETERTGIRALLNLGHTFGHALEAETGFSDTLIHGEAVAAGMALAFAYSTRRGLCPSEDAERVAAHLRAAGLPATLGEAGVDASGVALVAHMAHDKKREGGALPFLLARGIGRTFLDRTVDLADVAAFLNEERG